LKFHFLLVYSLDPPLTNFHMLITSGDLNQNEETPGLILEMVFYWEGAKIVGLYFPKRQSNFSVGTMQGWVLVVWWCYGCGPVSASVSMPGT